MKYEKQSYPPSKEGSVGSQSVGLQGEPDNNKILPAPHSLWPQPREVALFGVDIARSILEDQGFIVSSHPGFQANSNALLAKRQGPLSGKTVSLTVLPKTSNTVRQIRLGSVDFVKQRVEMKDDEFYFGVMPKEGFKSVSEEFDLFIIPAKVAAKDGMLAYDYWLNGSDGKKEDSIIIKDEKREPHKSIMDRWKRCFLYPPAIDWLPV